MFLLISLFLSYYTHCQGLQDAALMQALSDTISKGERYHYGTHGYSWPEHQYRTGTWSYFPLADITDDGKIWDMYSNCTRYFPYTAGESACSIEIEHCLPKSWWGWSKEADEGIDSVAYRDLFNLNPADARANNNKSNYGPGMVAKADKLDNGSFRMNKSNTSKGIKTCFEPADEYKGDFARTYFYMVTAYQSASWKTDDTTYINPQRYTMLSDSLQRLLLSWHRQDPVSLKEIHRASVITSVQHNHNPFIDYPDLVEYIWGKNKGEAVDFNQLTCTYDSTYVPPVFPRPTSDQWDTIINLSAVTANLVNAVKTPKGKGYASGDVQANGSNSVTMGTSSRDGIIAFSGVQSQDTLCLILRASIYDTGKSMQLNIFGDGTLLQTLRDTALKETRNELYYHVTIPAQTDSISIVSVGGSTTKRACIQELYVLQGRNVTRMPTNRTDGNKQNHKYLENRQVVIYHQGQRYSLSGQKH